MQQPWRLKHNSREITETYAFDPLSVNVWTKEYVLGISLSDLLGRHELNTEFRPCLREIAPVVLKNSAVLNL